LLENANTKYVAVLLNRNNVHYQYITFKAPDDDEYRAIVHRANLLRLIRMSEVLDSTEKLVLMSGGSMSAKHNHKKNAQGKAKATS
jgi:oxalate decarboxylase/phosphoglucose isomerase-like protein (cupin superfamily)